jgi:Cu(I)/Ag(I) efflux system membrane fusion protein
MVDEHVPGSDSQGSQAAVPEKPMTRRQKLWLVGLVILKRVRFLAILAAVGLFIGYWDTVMNYWDKWTRPAVASARALAPDDEFYCPMHPNVVRSTYEPNGDIPKCPICGMPLSIRKKGEAAELPAGVTGRVQLSPERVRLAGIKTVPVEYRAMSKETQTVGYIAYDETRLSRIVSRVEGYVEKLYVNSTFSVVKRGDPLAEIYSPELYSTAKELLVASRGSGLSELAASARTKLLLLGVSQEEIDGIVKAGKPSTTMIVRSPQAGYVVDKKVVAGSSVDAKMTLFEVADLSKVWIEADVFEKDIPFLQVGQKVEATVEAYPNRTFTGKVAIIYPQMEAATRTNRIRLELDNPQHELRPGMFATVRINTPLENIEPYKTAAAKSPRATLTGMNGSNTAAPAEFLVVPERAVVDTGAKKVVYVEREPGTFDGVEVELGPRQDEFYPVLKGLTAGDQVAAAGGFLIDAETRLNPGAASTYFGASGGPQSGGHSHPSASPSRPQGEQPHQDHGKPESGDAKPKAKVAVAELTAEQLANIAKLPEADQSLARSQRSCPITGAALGSMGVPVKITLRGQPVFLCCGGCVGKAKRSPEETLKTAKEGTHQP